MSARTTSDAVIAVLGSNYDAEANTDLSPFIATASALVDYVQLKDTDNTLSAELLELIERWLAGHFYAMADPLYSSKSTGGASGSFQGQTGMVLSATVYGQQAMLLDYTGTLAGRSNEAATGSKAVVQVHWLGKTL